MMPRLPSLLLALALVVVAHGARAGMFDNGAPNGAPITATGGTVARSAADRAYQDINSALDAGVTGDGTTDDTSRLNAALAGLRRVWLPATGHVYRISGTLTLGAGAVLACEPGVVIQSTSSSAQMWTMTGSGAQIRDCTFDGQGLNTGVAATMTSDHGVFWGGAMKAAGALFITGSTATHNAVERVSFLNGTATAIDITSNAQQNTVRNSEFQNNVGFGVRLDGGANHNIIDGNRTDGNGIELIGVVYDSYDNTIVNNTAKYTGDNGISVSGAKNRIIGNTIYGCRYTGIYIYGGQNTVDGNTAIACGQAHNPSSPYYDPSNTNKYSGISISGNYGGSGQFNVVGANFVDDDQVTKTQAYGFSFGGGYVQWAAGQSIASGSYEYNNTNIYKATTTGTTGATAPTCTTGTCSDGGVTWSYVSTQLTSSREPANNLVSGVLIWRFSVGPYNDGTQNHSNTIYLDGQFQLQGEVTGANTITGGFSRKVSTNWAQGLPVTYGQMVYTNSGSILYRVINVGGTTGASQPTCTSGTCTTADGIQWLVLTNSAINGHMVINSQDIRYTVPVYLPVMESTTAACPQFAGTGSPLGKVTASPCATYVNSSGGAGTTFYVKESATDATGWVAK